MNMPAADFPILATEIDGKPLVYLDNAATTQKPRQVLDALRDYYETANANVHRAAHHLSDLATERFEAARQRVRRFVNAPSEVEIVFTRGTTEAINLVAWSYAASVLEPGDEIVITEMEHHSNIVPWQLVAERTGARLVACPVAPDGTLPLDELAARIGERTRIVSTLYVSNALGTINPIAEIARLAHDAGAVLVVDGAQAMAHLEVDVEALGCDFFAFSGHKMYGPTGVGALWGREALLERMPPWQGGGEMIEHVTIERSTYQALPFKFEAGTPNIAGAIGLAAAMDYLGAIDRDALASHEDGLRKAATSALNQMEGIRIIGTAPDKIALVSFLLDGTHPNDVGTLLDQQGIAVRTGHHCAMPLMQRLGVPGTVRASFSLYNTETDVERLIAGVRKTATFM